LLLLRNPEFISEVYEQKPGLVVLALPEGQVESPS
jgi:hypothetical protein